MQDIHSNFFLSSFQSLTQRLIRLILVFWLFKIVISIIIFLLLYIIFNKAQVFHFILIFFNYFYDIDSND